MKVRLKQEFRNEITLEVSPYRYWTFVPGHVYDIEERVFSANRNFVEAVQEEIPSQPPVEFDRNVMFQVKEDETINDEIVFGEESEQTVEQAESEVQPILEKSEVVVKEHVKKIEPLYGKKRRK